MTAVSYLMKWKIKKILFEIISNTKVIYIYIYKILFDEVANDQDFAKLTGGLENVEYGRFINK